jgi:hypothetical protein
MRTDEEIISRSKELSKDLTFLPWAMQLWAYLSFDKAREGLEELGFWGEDDDGTGWIVFHRDFESIKKRLIDHKTFIRSKYDENNLNKKILNDDYHFLYDVDICSKVSIKGYFINWLWLMEDDNGMEKAIKTNNLYDLFSYLDERYG